MNSQKLIILVQSMAKSKIKTWGPPSPPAPLQSPCVQGMMLETKIWRLGVLVVSVVTSVTSTTRR